MDKIHFFTYNETHKLANKFFNKEKERINKIFPNIKIEHVGGTSIPNSLTLGDLDIQIKVTKEEFHNVCGVLKTFYHINKPEFWNDEFALFHWKDNPVIPMSIVLTVANSSFDDFSKIRDLLKINPSILEKYNNLKREYEGKSLREYKIAKRKFFGSNGKNNLL